ncbi:hypothetical protein GJ496_006333 [Pomphorhynchus laevis]|nr:hypothetical protein GJ496_006333 [Pomphorhynchus laevis]
MKFIDIGEWLRNEDIKNYTEEKNMVDANNMQARNPDSDYSGLRLTSNRVWAREAGDPEAHGNCLNQHETDPPSYTANCLIVVGTVFGCQQNVAL